MRDRNDWIALGGRLVALAVLGVVGVGALVLAAGVTLFAMVFLVGLTVLGAVGFGVAAVMRRFGRTDPNRPRIVEARYTVIREGAPERQ